MKIPCLLTVAFVGLVLTGCGGGTETATAPAPTPAATPTAAATSEAPATDYQARVDACSKRLAASDRSELDVQQYSACFEAARTAANGEPTDRNASVVDLILDTDWQQVSPTNKIEFCRNYEVAPGVLFENYSRDFTSKSGGFTIKRPQYEAFFDERC